MSKAGKEELCKLHRDKYLVPKKSQLEGINKAKNLAINDNSEPGDDEFIAKFGIFYMISSPIFI